VLAENGAQRRLCDLGGGNHEILDLHDRRFRLDDPEVSDRVHPRRDVVLGDHFLRRDVERNRAQVNPHHPVHNRDQDEQARALRLLKQPAKSEDDPALILTRDLDRRNQEQHEQ